MRRVEDIAALSAKAMLHTLRVGDPEEDASMASMRPILSKINAAGFVTIDSQTGKKGGTPYWQRAYISGFVSKRVVHEFVKRMNLRDSVVAFAFPHGEDQPLACQDFGWAKMPRLSLSVEGARYDTCTSHPLGVAQSFKEMWMNLLPELGLSGDVRTMREVAKDAAQVIVVDTVWGRKKRLFSATLETLQSL